MNVSLRILALAAGLLTAQLSAARADEPTPAALSLAATILADVGLKAAVDGELPTLALEIQSQLLQLHPELQTTLHETLVALVNEFQNADASVLGDLAHVMASKMTEQELRETQAFFEGPTGKKYLAVQPVLLKALGISESVWRPKVASDMMTRLRAELRKKGYEF